MKFVTTFVSRPRAPPRTPPAPRALVTRPAVRNDWSAKAAAAGSCCPGSIGAGRACAAVANLPQRTERSPEASPCHRKDAPAWAQPRSWAPSHPSRRPSEIFGGEFFLRRVAPRGRAGGPPLATLTGKELAPRTVSPSPSPAHARQDPARTPPRRVSEHPMRRLVARRLAPRFFAADSASAEAVPPQVRSARENRRPRTP